MLVELTIEANEESFVIIHQHGINDVNCKSRIYTSVLLKMSVRNMYTICMTEHNESQSLYVLFPLRFYMLSPQLRILSLMVVLREKHL